MRSVVAKVEAVFIGTSEEELSKTPCDSLQAELDGFVGDRHRSIERKAWAGDNQKEGTIRRNERQWSAVSTEELIIISKIMNLKDPIATSRLGANLSFTGIPDFSRLPKGTLLKFPSGAELMVEEYNPPCVEMSEKIASIYRSKSNKPLGRKDFSKAAKHIRGLVGVIDVAGSIRPGDAVTVKIYNPPGWLKKI